MADDNGSSSRPRTPESPMTNSLFSTNAHIEDLTTALANFSRVPSPDFAPDVLCCCSRDDCEHLRAWQRVKSKLESRLILSAEVGQALLQRHEAYVRRHERHRGGQRSGSAGEPSNSVDDERIEAETRISELLKEKASLEKLLNQALVNNEVAEVSNNTVLHELQEARSTVARLTSQSIRLMGLENRLNAVYQQRDDLQQERDINVQRVKNLESKSSQLQDRNAKLQAEVRRLQQDLEQRRLHRMEISQSTIQEARDRLQDIYQSVGRTALTEQAELTKMVESLVQDNDVLKQDNAELQGLLSDAREDLRTLQQAVEEQRARSSSRSSSRLHYRQHHHSGSVPSAMYSDNLLSPFKRTLSLERKNRHPVEPLSPASLRVPLPPSTPPTPSEAPHSTLYTVSLDGDDHWAETSSAITSERATAHKTLLLLSRSRGVQTEFAEAPPISLAPSQRSHISTPSPIDPRSESSSFSESQSSHVASIVERTSALLNRLTAADALTLRNRLKRQNLIGADVSHLSRTTVNAIVSEATSLRNHFRALLEDENIITTCTRNDLRRLFKLIREVFVELGQLRIVLNDIVLDPSIAPHISEQIFHPSKSELHGRRKDEPGLPLGSGWMAPISKLFSSPAASTGPSQGNASRIVATGGLNRLPSRVTPKIAPALAASTTTVNVEFSGTGIGRTNAISTNSKPGLNPDTSGPQPVQPVSYMGIFAGAHRQATPDPWVVLPRASTPMPQPSQPKSQNPAQLSHINAIVNPVDSPEQPHHEDVLTGSNPPPERTLRRRGLSDSSIHSTYMARKDERHPALHVGMFDTSVPHAGALPDRGIGVFQALSRRVQNFKLPALAIGSSAATAADANTTQDDSTIHRIASPPLSSLLPSAETVSTWVDTDSLGPFGSPREDGVMHGYRSSGHREPF